MKNIIIASLCVLSCSAYANDLSQEEQKNVKQLIQAFQKNEIEKIMQMVQYPLQRETPIPAVKNATELKQRFNQVFDASFRKQIAQSKLSDWSSMGWRGVMFRQGDLWLDGQRISAVNMSSVAEQKYKQQLINAQKGQLYSTLKDFKAPVLTMQTAKFTIRIDELKNNQYRYASWAKGKSPSTKPDLILNQGKVESSGSGGNHSYTFKSGTYTYKVERNHIGSDDTPAVRLEVSNKGKNVIDQKATLIE